MVSTVLLLGLVILWLVLAVVNAVVYKCNKKLIDKFNRDFDKAFKSKEPIE